MPRQNDPDFPQSELEMIEQAMNSMVQGTFNMLFHTLLGPEQNGPTVTTFETNSNGVQPPGMLGDGSDFRKLSSKSRQSRGTLPSNENNSVIDDEQQQENAPRSASVIVQDPELHNQQNQHHMGPPPMTNILQFMFGNPSGQAAPGDSGTGTLLDLMLPSNDRLFNSMEDPEILAQPRQVVEDSTSPQNSSWSFSSSSQRRVVKADGTEETYMTRTQNGITETIKRIKYPDGSMEESKETDGSKNSGIFSRLSSIDYPSTTLLSSPPSDQSQYPSGGPLSSMWKRFFG
ncbi:hypothetical protein BDB00DRAFT_830583 [Zychaea mexicana]|uniref:uncharacterized protein n=1 Tax=Zychaea mexicana TaxID=64656 RepID=UPI0022FEADE3|nr:uncharacterized protein BDB00DRAFT_830583 [Zychaea mexicana]KAI9491973.1 hypothetical protein BDB00DRAFT_830583 [Zychaea mexicana]